MYFCRPHKSNLPNTIKYKGANVVYSQTGSGQTLVFLHGFLEDKSMWNDFAVELSSEFNVITPDLLGQGESDSLGYVHQMEEMATSVLAILKQENIKECTVIGHSMGGYVALALAEMKPEIVSGLVLFHSTAKADSVDRLNDRERVISLVKRGKSVYIKAVVPSLFAAEARVKLKAEIQGLIDTATKYTNQGIIANIRGMMDRKDRSFVLKNGNFPKLIIHGELDSVISTSEIEEQSKLNRNITLKKFSTVGHMGHLEAKNECLAELKSFCKN